jgi:hypothetical protein
LVSALAEKYEGDPEKPIQLLTNPLQNSLKMYSKTFLKWFQNASNIFKFDYKMELNANYIEIHYPKFLEKQQKYFAPLGKKGFQRPTHIEKEKDIDKEEEKKGKPSHKAKSPLLTDESFIETLKEGKAYEGIDIDRELAKMDAWLLTSKGRRRRKTQTFILNWLNRIEKPMSIQSEPSKSAAEHNAELKAQQEEQQAKLRLLHPEAYGKP